MTVPEMLPRRAVADYLVGIVRLLGYEVVLRDLQVLARPDPDPVPEPPPALEPVPEPPKLGRISDSAKQLALSAPLTRFSPALSGGAHTHSFHAGEIGLATLAFLGDESVDARLLKQIRNMIFAGNEPSCTGGFQDQKQVCATATFLLAQETPRIWSALTNQEKDRIYTIMKAALVSAAYTCSDNNPNVLAGTKEFDIGGRWLGRDWNPNFQNGYVGQCIIGSLFWGDVASTLRDHDHGAFIQNLNSDLAGFPNILATYRSAEPDRPSDAKVTETLRKGFTWHGFSLSDPMAMYAFLTQRTFSHPVSAGLEDGMGVVGSDGKKGGLLTPAAQAGLPNKGKTGMLHEFKTKDASGPRSSHWYTREGWYVNNYLHWLLVALGYWGDFAIIRPTIPDRITVGTEDWFYKDKHGYTDFQHGKARAQQTIDEGKGRTINDELYRTVMAWHEEV